VKTRPAFSVAATKKYIAFYKPYQVLCQFSAEGEKTTLGAFAFPPQVYPVGRLDFDSEGLLLLSDDGRLTTRLFDESHRHPRTYLVEVERFPDDQALEKLASGVVIDGRKTLPCFVQLLEEPPALPGRVPPVRFRKSVPTAWLALTLWEGRNRQVRKMTAAIGFPTLRLVRYSIGDLALDDLALEPGQWIELSQNDLLKIFG
jgi:23S rRNA pseudouridine2457 synthase